MVVVVVMMMMIMMMMDGADGACTVGRQAWLDVQLHLYLSASTYHACSFAGLRCEVEGREA